jgi:hypothetical protein
MRESTPRSSVLTRLYQAVEWFGRTVFAPSDTRARKRGWEVLETGRLNRHYRDPRFDQLVRCAWCEGCGCPECGWTGRVERSECQSVR